MKLEVRLTAFTSPNFYKAIGEASGAEAADELPQVRYLATYLADAEVGARSMLVESPYVDRHYLQEYVGHYATTFRPVSSTTTRIHFFSRSISELAWDRTMLDAATSDERFAEVERDLNTAYLGYIVVRPLPGCPIGRTLLRRYLGKPSRCYEPASTPHEVHLHGFTFRVNALPFQQQDQALGACATTALWSALARVARADGGRALTPLDVARAVPGKGGALVSSPEGLNLDQMTGTIRALGYQVHDFTPTPDGGAPDSNEFLLALKAYVRGGIPVVLRINVGGEVHAVTVDDETPADDLGFRFGDDGTPATDLVTNIEDCQIRSTGLSRLYLHDDRLGPYSRYVFVAPTEAECAAAREGLTPMLRIAFKPRKAGFDAYESPAVIERALVPLYPKIRMNAKQLIRSIGPYLPVARYCADDQKDSVRVEPFYALGGVYLARLGQVLGDPARLAKIRASVSLPRYVGVLRFFSAPNEWLLDVVMDTTDVRRGAHDATLMVVPRDSAHLGTVANIGTDIVTF